MNLSLPTYTLVLPVNAVALVYNALSEVPAKTSRGLLNELDRQIHAQHRAAESHPTASAVMDSAESTES